MTETRVFLEDKLYALHLKMTPSLGVDSADAVLLRRNLQTDDAKLRQHKGVTSLQHGRAVAYCFDLQQPGMEGKYTRMVEQAAMHTLSSIGLLTGFTESYRNSGIEGNRAYLVTRAKPPVPQELSEDDGYDPWPDADDFK